MIFKDKEILARLEYISVKLDRLIAMQKTDKIKKACEKAKSVNKGDVK